MSWMLRGKEGKERIVEWMLTFMIQSYMPSTIAWITTYTLLATHEIRRYLRLHWHRNTTYQETMNPEHSHVEPVVYGSFLQCPKSRRVSVRIPTSTNGDTLNETLIGWVTLTGNGNPARVSLYDPRHSITGPFEHRSARPADLESRREGRWQTSKEYLSIGAISCYCKVNTECQTTAVRAEIKRRLLVSCYKHDARKLPTVWEGLAQLQARETNVRSKQPSNSNTAHV